MNEIYLLVENFRRELIGAPKWLGEKEVFEYENKSVEVVSILKLIRAAQGLTALRLLCDAGFIIDLGSSIRAINDCVEEIYFLLETYPERSQHVEKFAKNFFENSIDGYLAVATQLVPREKIRSARVRLLKGSHDDATQKLLERIYKAFCSYTHATCVTVMEIYEGSRDSYNLAGVPWNNRRAGWVENVKIAQNGVMMAGAFAARKFGREDYFDRFMGQYVE